MIENILKNAINDSHHKRKRLSELLDRMSHAKDEPLHFKNEEPVSTPREALDLFKRHRPKYWNDESVEWYNARVVSELIDKKWLIIRFCRDKEEYEVIEFDDNYEHMIEHRDIKSGKRLNFPTINAARTAIEKWKAEE